jgi:diaminopimelate epimerase
MNGMREPCGRTLRFEKWSGAGNDFVIVRAADLPSGLAGAELARRLSPRSTAIGADGLLLVDEDRAYFWNPDGSEAAFCGNGARCVAALLLEARAAETVDFTLNGRRVHGRACAEGYAVTVPAPGAILIHANADDLRARLGEHADQIERAGAITAGVPHLVLFFRGRPCWLLMDDDRVARTGGALSHDPRYGSGGVNVDFVWAAMPQDPAPYRIRTFERGVAGETLACGTGAVAAARMIFEIERDKAVRPPPAPAPGRPCLLREQVRLLARSGDVLTVARDGDEWTLAGTARRVFRGEWCES